MKIIRRGTPPQERTHRMICIKCKTEFEFQQSEAKITYDQRDGNFMSINCPVCNNLIHKDV